jgi:hypothetical protein
MITCHIDRRSTLSPGFSGSPRSRRQNLRIGVIAALAVYALMLAVRVTAQEANISTTVTSLGSGNLTSRTNLDAVKAKPATDRGPALPSLTLIDDGSGPHPASAISRFRLSFAPLRWRVRH